MRTAPRKVSTFKRCSRQVKVIFLLKMNFMDELGAFLRPHDVIVTGRLFNESPDLQILMSSNHNYP